jgi:quercetin dioxygenase-like cupin family protein
MKKLLVALCLTILFSATVHAQDSSGVTVSTLVKADSSWDGTPLPAYPNAKPEITILRITIPPGVALPLHQHPVINAVVLVSGELTVVTEDHRTKHLNAGDAIVEIVGKWHYGKSTGKDPAVILAFYAGVVDKPVTVRK